VLRFAYTGLSTLDAFRHPIASETFRARFARQGIHIHRINAENINKSP
jgi:hypothetical protein